MRLAAALWISANQDITRTLIHPYTNTHTLIPPNAHTHGHTHTNDKHEQNKDDKGVKMRNRIAMRCDRASVTQRTRVLHKGREAQSLV